MILVDTNVLLRSAQPSHSQYTTAVKAIQSLRLAGQMLCIVPQVLYEYWVVATRPVQGNGLGMTAAEADSDVQMLLSRFRFFRDERAVFERWHQLVQQHRVVGRRAHDARLVAAMKRHRINEILTFNCGDFRTYRGITVLDPSLVAR